MFAGALPGHAHRTGQGVFLSRSDWDGAALLDTEVKHLLQWRRPRREEAIYLITDDTRIPQPKGNMLGASKMWDHKQQRFVHGHLVVTAAFPFRGVALP